MFLLISYLIGLASIATLAVAEQPLPISVRVARADVIVVASLQSVSRLGPGDDPAMKVTSVPAAVRPGLFRCLVSLRVDVTLKGRVTTDNKVRFVWDLPSSGCVVDIGGDGVAAQRPALWLLRKEGGELYPVQDSYSGPAISLKAFSSSVQRRVVEWPRPELALTYLLLKPGVVIPEAEYATASVQGSLIDIGGWRDYLTAYAAVYTEANEYMRGQIALSVAPIGQCLAQAKKTAMAEGRMSQLAFVDLDGRRDDVEFRKMSWTTREEVLKGFGSLNGALDSLTLRACGSAPKTKQRAREVLSRYFSIEPSSLPCIPCEDK